MNSTMGMIARPLMSLLFIVAGVRKLMAFSIVAPMMAGKGFPIPEVLLALSIVLDIAGGLMLLLNWNARYAAMALVPYTLLVAAIFHNFWVHWNGSPPAFSNEINHFFKNLAVAGGLLMIAADSDSRDSVA